MTFRNGQPAVTSPAPRAVWESLIRSDADAVVSQSLAWRDAVCGAGRYRDVSRLYEFPSGRNVILPLARHRRGLPWLAVAASGPGVWAARSARTGGSMQRRRRLCWPTPPRAEGSG